MGKRIKELRKEKGVTLKTLSDAVGIAVSTLSGYEKEVGEKGYRNPKIENWIKLADYFKVPVDYLEGRGWSQDDVVEVLLFMIANRYNGYIGDPFYVEVDNGKVFKYGFDKVDLDSVDPKDLPGYKEKMKEYLKQQVTIDENEKGRKVTHSDDYLQDDYYDDYFDELVGVYAPNDEVVRQSLIDEIDNPTIDLASVLGGLLPGDEIRKIETAYIEFDSEDNLLEELHSRNETFFAFKKILLDNIKSLSDYAFLASIGEGWGMQPSPEYVIAKRLSDELQEKKFDSKMASFKVDPYKASKKNIDAMSVTSNDHELLFEIVAYLLDENKELKKRVDQLESKLPK
ncbi:helix-turn-helix domain-containing protein [Limosilactobacillus fermentum]|uniref:helix-turn-helix domain-containing protein n=1 Tax=Limosilactobacillus fermentum TaxID=1613 RepID=UPI0027BAC0E8|nr:helix-turn-helix transcriptional regulator [Limosilactobacillus fermentum]WLW45231.1 helix-turn-helix transcriptional regulator [Limosilactobacillus fermentum]